MRTGAIEAAQRLRPLRQLENKAWYGLFLDGVNTLRLARRIGLMLVRVVTIAALAVGVVVGPSAVAQEVAYRGPSSSRIVLDLGRRQIRVLREGQTLGPWPVAIGDPSTPTPTGDFEILTKKVNPVYVSHKSGQRRELSGASSPIGDRYLAFHRNGRGEFGIHGTPWPHWVQIRAAVSLGCVRMLNTHVRQLFDAVDVGTTLEIRS